MFISKFLRARLIIFTILLLVLWVTYYYLFRTTNVSAVKETAGFVSLVPEMSYKVMNARSTSTVLVTVLYECLCPDSRSFFANQLLPAVEKLTEHIRTDLIPYGKATTEVVKGGTFKFKCQHGTLECLGNKIHACTIKMMTYDLTKVKVITCMINNNYNPLLIGKKCCEDYNIDWKKVEICALGSEGDQLLKKHGDATNSLLSQITFIPTILLNKDTGNQAAILKDLASEICSILKKSSVYLKECD